jgi:hypothetical protein
MAFSGSGHGEASVHGEDWSYHGKAQFTRLPPRVASGAGLSGMVQDYSISKSQRAKKSTELLLQALSIDESHLAQNELGGAEVPASIADVHVATGKHICCLIYM